MVKMMNRANHIKIVLEKNKIAVAPVIKKAKAINEYFNDLKNEMAELITAKARDQLF